MSVSFWAARPMLLQAFSSVETVFLMLELQIAENLTGNRGSLVLF